MNEIEEEQQPIEYWPYFRKSIVWVFGNACFGLTPLLFMLFVNMVSGHKVGSEEISHLINDGVVLFVCCAILGAALIELMLSGMKMKISHAYSIGIVPLFILALILTDYFLINLKVIDTSCFMLSSGTSKIVILFSTVFCIFTKANLYIREATRRG